ncbi:MAG: hypothetical protein J7J98_00395 [candidate division Zixibacteria bacterium]|nr:hypothetical protein [candidate division Zixibacteria bacterium]
MRRILIIAVSLSMFLALSFLAGCDKEKIVESTEIVKETEYIALPPDTVFQTDTVFVNDSVAVYTTDTVVVTDTIVQVNYIYDTTTIVQNHYDTVTVTVIDTVMTAQCGPEEYTAMGALQYHCDPLVMQMIQQEFGLTDGWIYYLTSNQLEFTQQSATVYDIYGYIDYWNADWSGYYPLEFNWRMTFTGSDPTDPNHWSMSEPPAASPGLRIIPKSTDTQINMH